MAWRSDFSLSLSHFILFNALVAMMILQRPVFAETSPQVLSGNGAHMLELTG
jgi:hypothetical protein